MSTAGDSAAFIKIVDIGWALFTCRKVRQKNPEPSIA
jgi:hypothetical protein